MWASRKGLRVGRKQAGEVSTAVALGQGGPETAGRSRVAPAQHPGHDAPTGTLDGQPEPDFALFVAHKGPHLIEFERLPLLALDLFRPQA